MKVRTKSPETSVTDDANYFQFRFEPGHVEKGKRGQKIFVCDICRGIFKRSFSLKRHYLRFHINYAFLSPRDLNNCAIVASNHRAVSAAQNGSSGNDSSVSKKSNLLYRCHQCGFLVASKAELLLHLEKHPTTEAGGEEYVNGVNRCPKCSTAFTLRKTLRRHIKKNRCRNPNPQKDEGEGKKKEEEKEPEEMEQAEIEVVPPVVDDTVDDLEEIDMEASLKLGCSTSLFRFACTICSRMFQTYVNMCRHRRLAHGRFGICSPNLLVSRNKSKPYLSLFKMVPAKSLLKDSSSNDSLKDYVEIADVNSRFFIDGKRSHLVSAKSPIPEEDPQMTPSQLAAEEEAIKGELDKRWNWGSTNYNITELMRLDVPVQQAFFHGLSRWKPDEGEITVDRSTSQTYDDTHISSALDLQPVKNVNEENAAGSVRERPEFSGDWIHQKSYLCFPCGQVFQDYYLLQEHQLTAHSYVLYRHIEFDETRESVLPEIRNQAIRLHRKERLNDQEDLKTLSHQCTKCHVTLTSTPDLHSHILQCSNHISSSPRKRRSRIMGNSRRNHWHSAAGERKRGMSTYSTTTSSYSKANNRSVRCRSPKDDPNPESGDSTRRRSTRRVLSFSESLVNGNMKNGAVKRTLRERTALSSNAHAVAPNKREAQVDKEAKKKKLAVKEALPEKRSTRAAVVDKSLPKMDTCDWCKKRFQTRQSVNKHKLICSFKPVEQIVIVCDMAADDEGGQKRKSSGRVAEASSSRKAEQVTTKKKSEAPNERGHRKRGAEALKEEILSKAKAKTQVSSSQVPPIKKKKGTAAITTTPSTPVTAKKSTPKSQNATPKANDSVRTRAASKQSQQSAEKNPSVRSQTPLATPAAPPAKTAIAKSKTESAAARKRLSDVELLPQASKASQSINGRLRSKSGTAVATVKPMPVLKLAPTVAASTNAPALDKRLPELKLGGVLTIKKAIGVAALKTSEGTKRTPVSPKTTTSTTASAPKKPVTDSPKTQTTTPASFGSSSTKRWSSSTTDLHSRTSRRHPSDIPSARYSVDSSTSESSKAAVSTRPIRSSRRSSALSSDSLVNTDIERSFLEALLPEQRIKIAEQTCPFCSKHYVYRNNFKKHLLEGCDTPDAEESTPSRSAVEEARNSQVKSTERKPCPAPDYGSESKKKSIIVSVPKSSPKVKKKMASLKSESNGPHAGPKSGHVAKGESSEKAMAKNSASASASVAAMADHLRVDPIDPQLKSEICRTDDHVPPIREERKLSKVNVETRNSPTHSTPDARAGVKMEFPDPLSTAKEENAVAHDSVSGEVSQCPPTTVEACSNDPERHVVASEVDANKARRKGQPDMAEQERDSLTSDNVEKIIVQDSIGSSEEVLKALVHPMEEVDEDAKESIPALKSSVEDATPVEKGAAACHNEMTVHEDDSKFQGALVLCNTKDSSEDPAEESGSKSVDSSPNGSSEKVRNSSVEKSSEMETDPIPPVPKEIKNGEIELKAPGSDCSREALLNEIVESEDSSGETKENKVTETPEVANDAETANGKCSSRFQEDCVFKTNQIDTRQLLTNGTQVPEISEISEEVLRTESSKAPEAEPTKPISTVSVDGQDDSPSTEQADACGTIEDESSCKVDTSSEVGCNSLKATETISTSAAVEENGRAYAVDGRCEESNADVVATKSAVNVNGAVLPSASGVPDDTTIADTTENVVIDLDSSEKKVIDDYQLLNCAPKIVEPLQKVERIDAIPTDIMKSDETISSSTDEGSTSLKIRSADEENPSLNRDSVVNTENGKLNEENVTSSDHVSQTENSIDSNAHVDFNVAYTQKKEEEDQNRTNDSTISKKDVDLQSLTQVNMTNICSQIAANICQYPTQS